MSNTKTNYNGIDLARFIFACLIPLLHINLPGAIVPYIQQYISRLGVPFFFAVSGMFLYRKNNGIYNFDLLWKFAKRIGILLLVWVAIYFPIFFRNGDLLHANKIIFDTPGYLWYLSAIFIASIPFCLIRRRNLLYCGSFILYAIGTFCSDSYKWMWGGGGIAMKKSFSHSEMVYSLGFHFFALESWFGK